MKACIITFQSAYNYGAVLQAYALENYITDHFAETKILNYHNIKIDTTYKRPGITAFKSNPKGAALKFLQYFLYKEKRYRIELFRQKLNLTQYYDEHTVNQAVGEADVFITGSDQVWNYQIIDKDPVYFLDFVKNKATCSYAASFGVSSIPDEMKTFYTEKINQIQHLSVREKQGIDLVRELCNRQCKLVIDPTLLLYTKEWEKLSITPNMKTSYILVYKITKADQLIRFAKFLSRKTGLPIVYIPNDLKSGIVGKTCLNVGPQEWLGYIQSAEYVVTNSFHGTVFSIIFGRKFFSEVSAKANAATSRLKTLLEIFDMEERIISNYSDDTLNKELPKDRICAVLSEQRIVAHSFLKKVFDGVETDD